MITFMTLEFILFAVSIACCAELALEALIYVSYWFILKKAGQPGWKGIIPYYNQYVFFDICWDTSFFWIKIALIVAAGAISGILGAVTIIAPTALPIIIILSVISILISAALLVLEFFFCKKLADSFGRGTGFAFGLMFLSFIFMPILAFDNSRYTGKQNQDFE